MLEDVVTYILACAFVFAAFYLLGVRGKPRTAGWLAAWGVVLLFVALLVGSAWSETVNPLLRRGEWVQAARAAAGFLVILAGLGAVLYGGFRFVQGKWRPGTGWLLVGIGGIGLGGLVSGEGEDVLARAVVTAVLLGVGGFLVWKTTK